MLEWHPGMIFPVRGILYAYKIYTSGKQHEAALFQALEIVSEFGENDWNVVALSSHCLVNSWSYATCVSLIVICFCILYNNNYENISGYLNMYTPMLHFELWKEKNTSKWVHFSEPRFNLASIDGYELPSHLRTQSLDSVCDHIPLCLWINFLLFFA